MNNQDRRERVVVGLSGGVDSAVAAGLLRDAGYDVVGVTMRLWTEEDHALFSHHRRCCSVEDVDDARRICQVLGVPHYVLNMERPFQQYVVDYFVNEYARGRTPNPCLACNAWLKFHFLLGEVRAWGAEHLATGHYARIERTDESWELLRGLDRQKDQSYVLHTLTQEQLARLLFPVGHLHKREVRDLARRWGLPVAEKRDSQEICFVRQGLRRFLAARVPSRPGRVLAVDGRIVGEHEGIAYYTIGQRRGLGLALGCPAYVAAVDADTNTVTVGPREALAVDVIEVEDLSFTRPEYAGERDATVRTRYQSQETAAELAVRGSAARVRLGTPLLGVAPGQAAVFYQGERVLGGGTIVRAWRDSRDTESSRPPIARSLAR